MTTQLEQAARLALEALECKDGWGSSVRDAKEKAITALRAALEQPAQDEPVAWLYQYKPAGTKFVTLEMAGAINHQQVRETPLYTRPQAREPLTNEQIDALPWEPSYGNPMTLGEGLRLFARAIEAAHGIKGKA